METFNGFEVIERPLPDPTDDAILQINRTGRTSLPLRQRPMRHVIHAMAEQLDVTDGLVNYYPDLEGLQGQRIYAATFLERAHLSAHFLVASGGEPIRCRQDTEYAWHAKGFNFNSVGTEILVPGVYNYQDFIERIHEPGWVGDDQWRTAVEIARYYRDRWRIPSQPGKLDRHSDLSPHRKQDPGDGFEWEQFVADVAA